MLTVEIPGHGTHVSGTAAGSRFGVAKAANIIAVKVLNSAGYATESRLECDD